MALRTLLHIRRLILAAAAAFLACSAVGAAEMPVRDRPLAARGEVFTNPGRCYRTAVTYNSALRRYLLCQILFGEEPRFVGGFGIYDAPEPWGPWTTAYFTPLWDVGPGETSSIPTKWMSADGTSFHLVFSGDDCFSVRRAKIITKKEE
jgi:hypothetical protein